MAKRREEPQQTLPLSDSQKELMLTVLLRDEASFQAARTQLQPKHFSRDDRRLALVWNTAQEVYDRYGQMPTDDQLSAEIEQKLPLLEDQLDDDEVDDINRMLRRTFAIPAEDVRPRYGLAMCKRFIVDALAAELAQAGTEWQDSRPLDFGQLLSRHQEQVAEVEALDADFEESFPENWTPKSIRKVSTGMPFFDHMMNGGQAAGEVYGLLGPFGSCKTTLLSQTAVAQCKLATEGWQRGGKQGLPQQIYVASYEESLEEIRMRMMGNHASILRDRLEDIQDWSGLENDELLPYEREFFADRLRGGKNVRPERQRAAVARRQLSRTLVILDMTGADKGRGAGLVDELAAAIRADQRKKGNPGVYGVFVDYAGAAVERYLDSRELDRKDMRHYLKPFPLHCKQKIAVPFQTSVWVAHQLSGNANSKGSGSRQHHTDAAETKSFAENLVFCFTVGVKDQQTNNCLLAKTKARRAGGSPDRIIRVAGELWRVEDVDHLYMVDPHTDRIALRSDMNRVHDVREPSGAVPGARNHDMTQFSAAALAGEIPGAGDDRPRNLARRNRER